MEVLLRNNAFGHHVRHVRVMAETFAIASAENTLATGLYHPAESALTNRHGDNFVVQQRSSQFNHVNQFNQSTKQLRASRGLKQASSRGWKVDSLID
jgi:hypothetical protein